MRHLAVEDSGSEGGYGSGEQDLDGFGDDEAGFGFDDEEEDSIGSLAAERPAWYPELPQPPRQRPAPVSSFSVNRQCPDSMGPLPGQSVDNVGAIRYVGGRRRVDHVETGGSDQLFSVLQQSKGYGAEAGYADSTTAGSTMTTTKTGMRSVAATEMMRNDHFRERFEAR